MIRYTFSPELLVISPLAKKLISLGKALLPSTEPVSWIDAILMLGTSSPETKKINKKIRMTRQRVKYNDIEINKIKDAKKRYFAFERLRKLAALIK
jgi:hypothetical protein